MADYTNLDPKTLVAPPVTATIRMRSLIIGAIGAVICLIGAFIPGGAEHLIHSWLVAFMFWLGLSLGCMGLLMLTYMVGGWWGFIPRRIFLAGAQNVYLMAIFFLPILIWRKSLYIWMTDEFRSSEQHASDVRNLPASLRSLRGERRTKPTRDSQHMSKAAAS